MRVETRFLIGAVAACAMCGVASAKNYNADYASVVPVIDGVVSAGEWDDASKAGGWVLLGTTKADTEGNYFKAKWNNKGLYLLAGSNYGGWLNPEGNAGFTTAKFNQDNVNFFFDPNKDGEALKRANYKLDYYQLILNQYKGNASWDGANIVGTNIDSRAASNAQWGSQSAWKALRDKSRVAMKHGTSGGVTEVFISWSEFDAGNDLSAVNGPAINDKWMFLCTRISTDKDNELPTWHDTGGPSFVEGNKKGWGTMTFVPEPASLAIFGLAGLAMLRRRK